MVPIAHMRVGTHPLLEEEANRLLRKSMAGVTRHSEKSDILTPWKQQERHRREVYTASGRPDQAVRRGMFGRRANATRPDLNSREGVVRSNGGGLQRFMDEQDRSRSSDAGGFG